MSNYLPFAVRNVLIKTGWSQNELIVYSLLLEKGGMTISEMSKSLGISISTLQHTLKTLTIKKMVERCHLNHKPVYVASGIGQLKKWVNMLSKEASRFNGLVGKFVNQYDFDPATFTPKANFFEGTKNVQKSYQEFLETLVPEDLMQIDCGRNNILKKIDRHKEQRRSITKDLFNPDEEMQISIADYAVHYLNTNQNGDFSVTIEDPGLAKFLRSIFGVLWKLSDKIRVYEGINGLKKSYDDMLNLCSQDCIYGFISISHQLPFDLEKWLAEQYIPMRMKKRVINHSIAVKSQHALAYQKRDKDELRQIKLVMDKNFVSADGEVNIAGDFIHLTSFNPKHCFGLILKDATLANILQGVFFTTWQELK